MRGVLAPSNSTRSGRLGKGLRKRTRACGGSSPHCIAFPVLIFYASAFTLSLEWIEGGFSFAFSNYTDARRCDAVHLESTDTPAAFERVYREKYLTLLTQARLFATQTSADPSRTLVVLSTGMDACIGELPGLQRHGKSLPVDFYHRFTVDACALAADVSGGKLISVLEGGYSDRALTSASLAHCAALATASSSSSSSLSSASAPPSTPKEWWDADALLALEKLSKRLATAAPSTPAAIASAAARRRAEPAWLQATGAHFEVLERACGREQPRRAAKTAASAPVSPAGSNTAPRMGTRGARNRTQLGEASAADTTV